MKYNSTHIKTLLVVPMLSMLLMATGCDGYEPGDYYRRAGEKGVVVQSDADGNPVLLLSMEEERGYDADSAQQWSASLADGWHLPDKEEMEQVRKYRSLLNSTLVRKGAPKVLEGHTFYWTATRCSETHFYACGPDGIRCYFHTTSSPLYRIRAVKRLDDAPAKNNE